MKLHPFKPYGYMEVSDNNYGQDIFLLMSIEDWVSVGTSPVLSAERKDLAPSANQIAIIYLVANHFAYLSRLVR
jgi:hypothetical protein